MHPNTTGTTIALSPLASPHTEQRVNKPWMLQCSGTRWAPTLATVTAVLSFSVSPYYTATCTHSHIHTHLLLLLLLHLLLVVVLAAREDWG